MRAASQSPGETRTFVPPSGTAQAEGARRAPGRRRSRLPLRAPRLCGEQLGRGHCAAIPREPVRRGIRRRARGRQGCAQNSRTTWRRAPSRRRTRRRGPAPPIRRGSDPKPAAVPRPLRRARSTTRARRPDCGRRCRSRRRQPPGTARGHKPAPRHPRHQDRPSPEAETSRPMLCPLLTPLRPAPLGRRSGPGPAAPQGNHSGYHQDHEQEHRQQRTEPAAARGPRQRVKNRRSRRRCGCDRFRGTSTAGLTGGRGPSGRARQICRSHARRAMRTKRLCGGGHDAAGPASSVAASPGPAP